MKCNLVMDLLPLYMDGLCSKDTENEIKEHIEQCPDCQKVMEELEKDFDEPEVNVDEEIMPFRKVKKKMRKKNVVICLAWTILGIVLIMIGILTYGQLNKTGISFEYIVDAIKMKNVGEQFAKGNIDPLYEIISNDLYVENAEKSVLQLAYQNEDNFQKAYEEDVKKTIKQKFDECLAGKNLEYNGIYEIGYQEFMKKDQKPTLTISLEFLGDKNTQYYINLYKVEDGKFLVDDYFGVPQMTFSAEDDNEWEDYAMKNMEVYHTEDSLFACLPNELSNINFFVERIFVKTYGQRMMNGDMEKFGVSLPIVSEEDMKNNTYELQEKFENKFEELQKLGYFLTDVHFEAKEYNRDKHLFRYVVVGELTKQKEENKMFLTFEGYRIADQILYIPDSINIYDNTLSSEKREELIERFDK